DDEIVDNATRLAQHAAVERLPGCLQLVDIVGEKLAQKLTHPWALQIDDAHVRNVEDPGCAPHSMVLGNLRAVLNGHIPSAEIDDPGAQLLMKGKQGSLSAHRNLRLQKKGGRPQRPAAPLSCNLRDRTLERVAPLRWVSLPVTAKLTALQSPPGSA